LLERAAKSRSNKDIVPEALYLLGSIYVDRLQEPEEGIPYLQELLQLDEDEAGEFLGKAKALLMRHYKRSGDLANYLDMCTDISENHPEVFGYRRIVWQLGNYWKEAGQFEEAIVHYERMLAMYPEDKQPVTLLYILGDLHEKLGSTDKATAFFQKFLLRVPPTDVRLPSVKKKLIAFGQTIPDYLLCQIYGSTPQGFGPRGCCNIFGTTEWGECRSLPACTEPVAGCSCTPEYFCHWHTECSCYEEERYCTWTEGFEYYCQDPEYGDVAAYCIERTLDADCEESCDWWECYVDPSPPHNCKTRFAPQNCFGLKDTCFTSHDCQSCPGCWRLCEDDDCHDY